MRVQIPSQKNSTNEAHTLRTVLHSDLKPLSLSHCFLTAKKFFEEKFKPVRESGRAFLFAEKKECPRCHGLGWVWYTDERTICIWCNGTGEVDENYSLNSPKVLDRSPNVLVNSPNVLDKSPNVLDNSPNISVISPNVLDRSPNVLDRSPKGLDSYPNVLDKSPNCSHYIKNQSITNLKP